MLADIASGNTETADVLFLVAAIVFALATIIAVVRAVEVTPNDPPARSFGVWYAPLIAAGLTLLSIAWLAL